MGYWVVLGFTTVSFAGQYDLAIEETSVNMTGRDRPATTINGSIPGPLLRWREGEDVTINVTNHLKEPTSIHWHGIILPFDMDGVPGVSFAGIAPGETFTYRFTVKQSGTYWYHSHSGFQEQSGVYGPLVIEPRHPKAEPVDREYVVMLSDWTDEDPHRVFAKLKKQSDYYNVHRRTLFDLFRDASAMGWRAAIDDRLAWGRMRMNPTDIADVTGATYTYLLNGQPPGRNWT
ncbi:MAG: multicopper oxidase domain-containing protein, partial [Nitrospiria bacterium]